MKVRRQIVKTTRHYGDWYDGRPPSMSPAAYEAMAQKPAASVGFHKPQSVTPADA